MEFLHAPWRTQYLSNKEDKSSVFLDIIQSGKDEKNHVIVRAKTCLAVLNKFPYTTAHTMIVPYKMTGDLTQLIEQELCEIMTLTQLIVGAIRKEFNPDGFNIGFNLGAASGAGIEQHLHLHIVPRWHGDHNFITILGGTRIHPNELDTVWKKLKQHFQ